MKSRDISHVIFDFDGTLSWLRHGWPEIMLNVFRPYFPKRPEETEAEIHDTLIDDILGLNGKPSIHQMTRFVERVRERGGISPAAGELLIEYQMRLDRAICDRSQKILRGAASADEFVVHGARAILETLGRRGMRLIILSGTVEHRVRQEAIWLGLGEFFGDRIYGSHPDRDDFSKQEVIRRIMREENIQGGHLLSFGDGPVEIANTKEAGGWAIGVASDENTNGSGECDPHKKRQLLAAGADEVIADYREGEGLLARIFS